MRRVRPELLLALVMAVLLAAVARRYDVSAPLALVLAGLAIGLLPGLPEITLDPELVLFVLLPPLLWSAGLESSYVNMRRSKRAIGMLAVGLPLATTIAVGFVAFQTVPQLTLAAALTLGAIVAPPDAVSASAIGRRLSLPRRIIVDGVVKMCAALVIEVIAEGIKTRAELEALREIGVRYIQGYLFAKPGFQSLPAVAATEVRAARAA